MEKVKKLKTAFVALPRSADSIISAKPEDVLETEPFLRKHKETETQRVELLETKSDETNFFSVKETVEGLDDFSEEGLDDVGEVVRVRFAVSRRRKHLCCCGFVEFASANEAKNALQKKNGEKLHHYKVFLDVAGATYLPPPKYCIDHKVCYEEDYLQPESLPIQEVATVEGLDKSPAFAETIATVRNKMLFVTNLAFKTQISDIINFFKDVGEVVHVRLLVNRKNRLKSYGFVGFASASEANKALEKKNGEYLHNREIILGVANHGAKYLEGTTKVWYKDYLQRESLLIEEDAAAMEGLDETPDFAEEVALRKKTLFVASNFSDKFGIQGTFFCLFKEIVRVRFIVDHKGEHVGCCFVELASSNEAKRAVQQKNGNRFSITVAEIDRPYPFRPRYKLAERLWYEDNLLRKNFGEKSKKSKEKLVIQFSGKKTIFSHDEG